MLLVLGLFWVLLIWALYESEIYAGEATILVLVWAALLAIWLLLPKASWVGIVGFVLLDVYLLFKAGILNVSVR